MGRTRGKFTNKVIYLENSGLQPIGGQYLQNVGGQLYWNGVNIGSTTVIAGDVTYDDTGNTYVIGDNVDEALASIETAFSTIVQEGTTASNGLTKTVLDVALGGTLTKNTSINLSAFLLDIANSLNSRIEAGGTNLRFTASDKMMFLISTLSSTSQNKSLQLNNTDGKLELVNKGMFGERASAYAPGAYSIVISEGNGLTPNNTTNTGDIISAGTIEHSLSSFINNSSTADFVLRGYLLKMDNMLQGSKVSVDVSVTVRSDKNVVLFPLINLSVFGSYYTNTGFASTAGLPKLNSGYGFSGGTYCGENETCVIRSSFIFDYDNSGLDNSYGLSVYRNLDTSPTADNLIDATIQILGWKFTFRQA